MRCNKNIVFPVIVIRMLHFNIKKKMQLWSRFGWMVELRIFTYYKKAFSATHP
jgi:hypothetical protein